MIACINNYRLAKILTSIKRVIKDVSEVAHENSILLLLSNYEGFGNVLVEAYSVGMPVIVYNSYPAAKSIVTPNAGKLLPYGNIKEVLNQNTRAMFTYF